MVIKHSFKIMTYKEDTAAENQGSTSCNIQLILYSPRVVFLFQAEGN